MIDVAVVGGGIAGLTAAHAAHRAGRRVVLLEAGPVLGGKISATEMLGAMVDAGPDSFLARRPEAVALCRELGLEDELVSPATGQAFLWTRGGLQAIPGGLVLGVPARFRPLLASRALSPRGRARALLDAVLPGQAMGDGDDAIGAVVARRFGREVAERLVDPLLGGINAGRSENLSMEASAPQLVGPARAGRGLARALRAQLPAASSKVGTSTTSPAPVFHSLRAGVHRLPAVLEQRLRAGGVELRTDTAVSALRRSGESWTLVLGGGEIDARAVVLATPAFVTAELLAPHAPGAADDLRAVEHASVALVTLAYESGSTAFPAGSGFLVPRRDGRLLTACTWFSAKWPHIRPDGASVVRLSAGKAGDDRAANMTDEGLVGALRAELAEATGVAAQPLAVRVTRFPRSFPQYAVGHLARVARIEHEADALGGIGLAGAAYRGVGIPACIGSAERAVQRLLST